MTSALALHGLARNFGPIEAVRDLTFDVQRGELFGMVGPDGAGKTTTLRMLAGVLPPTRGDAEILGISVARDPEAVKPHIAYMSQRFGLYTDLTVRENIDFYADLYRVPRPERPARLQRLYRFSNLGEFEHRLAGQLSGGMKQKLGLCCALVHHPDILLLDEPTFGVDPISRRDLWLILHQMVGEGMTIVITTSYLDEAERCDRVALLHQGRVLALAPPAELQQGMKGTLLVVHARDARAARATLRNVEGVDLATLFGHAVHVLLRDPSAEARVRAALSASGNEILEAEQVDASLEDVFINLVAGNARDV
ncbi:MAG: ATP-binding cassette domain-containing protein [Longimicrobiales bacterium]